MKVLKVGRTPWSAAGPLAGLRELTRISGYGKKTGQGAGRGPGGPSHQTPIILAAFVALALAGIAAVSPTTSDVKFTDITTASGIKFTHNSGRAGKKFLP